MNTLNLATKNTTVLPTGEAYISQRKAAELLGVVSSTLSRFYSSNNVDTKQGVSAEMLSTASKYYAFKGKPEAQSVYSWLAEGGSIETISSHKYEEAPKRIKEKAGYVYIIQSGAFYKIGKALDVKARLKGLQCGNPVPLKLILSIKTDSPFGLEGSLHYKYRSQRGLGGWFTLSDGDLLEIQAIAEVIMNTLNLATKNTTDFTVLNNGGSPKKEAQPNDLFYYFQAMGEPVKYSRSQLHSFGFSDRMIAQRSI